MVLPAYDFTDAFVDTPQIVVILVLRYLFMFQNSRRDRAVAEGRVEYNENTSGLEDLSDWKNPAFRYVTVCIAFCLALWRFYLCTDNVRAFAVMTHTYETNRAGRGRRFRWAMIVGMICAVRCRVDEQLVNIVYDNTYLLRVLCNDDSIVQAQAR